MKKILKFNFYLTEDTFDCYSNRLHFELIKSFRDVFDEFYFNISLDDIEETALIRQFEDRILDIVENRTVKFNISRNNQFRESQFLYDSIYTNRHENDLVFFAHNKGITNFDEYPSEEQKDSITSWIVGLYYFNLIDIGSVTYNLIERQCAFYGWCLVNGNRVNTKNHFMFNGTFYWVNNFLLQMMKNDELPLYNRYFSEDMPGNTVKFENVYSYQWKYLSIYDDNYDLDFYNKTNKYIRIMYDDDTIDKFFEFRDKILNNIL